MHIDNKQTYRISNILRSVIQRQLWLLHNGGEGMTSQKAYDQARREFYEVRHEEDVERRVSREEALATGAYFGKSRIDVGMELEDKMYASWKDWASKEISVLQTQRAAAYTGIDPEADPLPVAPESANELEIAPL